MSNLNFWGKLHKLREGIKLENERKLVMRENLIREINSGLSSKSSGLGGFFWNRLAISGYEIRYSPAIVSLSVLIMTGTGISFAADRSLPGDLLYSVKVNVNEEVRGSLIFNDKAKAEWEANLATRRLEEAEKLTLSGKINEEVQQDLENKFEEHSKKVSERIAKFQEEKDLTSAAEISSKFETSLSAHRQILKRLGDEAGSSTKGTFRKVEEKVKTRLKNTESKRTEIDTNIIIKAGEDKKQDRLKEQALNKIKSAENSVNSLQKFLERKIDKVGIKVVSSTEDKVNLAVDLISQAKEKINQDSYGEAFNLAQNAIRVADKTRALLNASIDFDLNGRLISEKDDNEDDDKDTQDESNISVGASSTVEVNVPDGSDDLRLRKGNILDLD